MKKDLLAGVSEGAGSPETYGLALEILSARATGDGVAYGHGGDLPSFHSLALYFPAHEWTVTAIVNREDGDPSVIMTAVTSALRKASK